MTSVDTVQVPKKVLVDVVEVLDQILKIAEETKQE